MSQTSFFIYGSCVSRDVFRFAREGSFHIADYYARSSLISAMAPPVAVSGFYDLEKITSNFRRRSVERDLSKTLLNALTQKKYDILLLDFIDERISIMKVKRTEERELCYSLYRIQGTPARYCKARCHQSIFTIKKRTLEEKLEKLHGVLY